MKSRQWAIIKTQVEGIHRFPEATDEEKYLSYPHRHIFHITVYIEQFHGDRDIEYIVFKKFLSQICPKGDIGTMSCEQIAEHILSKIKERYPNRKMKIVVLEDGENGAELEEL